MAVGMATSDALGEHKVETGVGIIKEIDRRERNLGIKIAAEGLRQPVTGWVDLVACPRDMPALIGTAHEEGRQIRYRIVVRRKDIVDKAVPFAELTIDQKVRDMVEVVFAAGAGTTPTPPPVQNEAPDDSGAPVTAPNPENGLQAEAPGDADAPPDTPRPQARRGVKVQESKPWEEWNTDGSVNTGSYAYQAALTIVDTAHGLILRHLADQYDKASAAYAAHEATQPHGAGRAGAQVSAPPVPAPPTMARVGALAKKLLAVADAVQATMRADGKVDRMDNSHARARAALATALKAFPPPFDQSQDEAAVAEWVETLTARAADLALFAHDATLDFLGPFETGGKAR